MPGDKDAASKPQAKEELYVLCVDATEASDSAAFFHYLKAAGLKVKGPKPAGGGRKRTGGGINVTNLLDLVHKGCDAVVASEEPTKPEAPFKPSALKEIPIEEIPVPDGAGPKVKILLPQGKVTGKVTHFDDPALGATAKARVAKAESNSELLKDLLVAPGLSKCEDGRWLLDFARRSDLSPDIVYLSGHGGMSGLVCGEAGPDQDTFGYIRYFEPMRLITEDVQKPYRGSNFVSPRWMVVAACYSMREIHAGIWLRLLEKQDRPVRGILGYRLTAPLAKPAVEINRRFAKALGEGATFIEAWKKAHHSSGSSELAQKWTAMAFDYAENDTLASLRDLGAGNSATLPPKGNLYHYREEGRSQPIQIRPPLGLLEIEHWRVQKEKDRVIGAKWNKILTTNIDSTKGAPPSPNDKDPNRWIDNDSWSQLKWPESLQKMTFWDQNFYPSHYYALRILPPFRAPFTKGFHKDVEKTKENPSGFVPSDELELSLIHVRPDRKKERFSFLSVFDVLRVNGAVPEKDKNYWIPSPSPDPDLGKSAWSQQQEWSNRIRFACPPEPSRFKPAWLLLRYKVENKEQPFLWFWFRVRIFRDGVRIFSGDFDTSVVTQGHMHYQVMLPTDPVPPGLGSPAAPTPPRSR